MVNQQKSTALRAGWHREDVYLHPLDQCFSVAREEIVVASDAHQHVHRIGVHLKSAVGASSRHAPLEMVAEYLRDHERFREHAGEGFL